MCARREGEGCPPQGAGNADVLQACNKQEQASMQVRKDCRGEVVRYEKGAQTQTFESGYLPVGQGSST